MAPKGTSQRKMITQDLGAVTLSLSAMTKLQNVMDQLASRVEIKKTKIKKEATTLASASDPIQKVKQVNDHRYPSVIDIKNTIIYFNPSSFGL